MRAARPLLLTVATLLACGPDLPTKEEVAAGEADPDVDWCAEGGWYDDGVCDWFCRQPDADCEACVDTGGARICPLPLGSHAPPAGLGEVLEGRGLRLETVHHIEQQGRGKYACQYDPQQRGVACVGDVLAEDWSTVGTRLLRFDGADFSIAEQIVSPHLHSSYLWGDFNGDGQLDFFGFSDGEEPQQHPLVLYLGTSDPFAFEETEPIVVDHPVKGGAVLDFDGDGCEDLLVLGTAVEDWEHSVFTYYEDYLFRGDCAGGFTLANDAAELDQIVGFAGNGLPARFLGRAATITDFDRDDCPDLVIGNYRAHPNFFLRSDCKGHFSRWEHDPDDDPARSYFGHTVGLFGWDRALVGELDLFVFNLWHPDERGELLDKSAVLVSDGSGVLSSEELGYFVEAPFGALVADLDHDRRGEVLIATGERWQPYRGKAAILDDDAPPIVDEEGWLQFRETPVATDLDGDGTVDLIGDGRVVDNRSPAAVDRRWLGLVFVGLPLSGSKVVLVDGDGGRAAFALAQDSRGQPSNMLTLGLGDALPASLELHLPSGERFTLSLAELPFNRYLEVTLER